MRRMCIMMNTLIIVIKTYRSKNVYEVDGVNWSCDVAKNITVAIIACQIHWPTIENMHKIAYLSNDVKYETVGFK